MLLRMSVRGGNDGSGSVGAITGWSRGCYSGVGPSARYSEPNLACVNEHLMADQSEEETSRRSRKRRRQFCEWKRSKRKAAVNSGQGYVTSSGNTCNFTSNKPACRYTPGYTGVW